MPNYRVYFLTDGHTTDPPNIIEANDDSEAIQRAKSLLDGHDLEVWHETRLVGTILSKG
jgi:hypothetical protein